MRSAVAKIRVAPMGLGGGGYLIGHDFVPTIFSEAAYGGLLAIRYFVCLD